MVLKKRLAREIVEQFHDKKAAKDAEAEFERVVQRGEVPEHVPHVVLGKASLRGGGKLVVSASVGRKVDIIEFLANAKVVKSRSEAKRLLAQGAIEVDGQKVTINTVQIWHSSVIKVGKRRFVKIVDADKRT